MLKPRTLKILGFALAAYVLLLALGLFWPPYLDSPARVLILVPTLSAYLFHSLGVSGLLQNKGLCGAGWCALTWFGWAFVAAVWVMIAWGISWAIASLTSRIFAPPSR